MITIEYLSYENEAALLVGNFSPDGLFFDHDAATHYTQIFLEDYRLALLSPHTTPESFLHAYTYREMAKLAGASETKLDNEAYMLRQIWAKDTL